MTAATVRFWWVSPKNDVIVGMSEGTDRERLGGRRILGGGLAGEQALLTLHGDRLKWAVIGDWPSALNGSGGGNVLPFSKSLK